MRTIALRKMKVVVNNVTEEVYLDPNRYVETIRWTHIMGMCWEETARPIQLFVIVGGTEIPLKLETPTIARDTVQVTGDIYLSGNYVIGMRGYGVTAGQELTLTAFGLVEDPVTV